jgi:glucose-6-phosphate dehydrogenase assembly protein OpcA
MDKPNIGEQAARFAASPTQETLQAIMRDAWGYCSRTRHPRYNQAALAAAIFERVKKVQSKLPPSILTSALKAEACYDAFIQVSPGGRG